MSIDFRPRALTIAERDSTEGLYLPVSQAWTSCRDASPPSMEANCSLLRFRASLMILIDSGLKRLCMGFVYPCLMLETDYHYIIHLSRNIYLVK